jgi:hypothetical protein
LDEPGSGRWFLPYRKYLFYPAGAIEHSLGSRDTTAVRLVPLRHFLGSVWLFLVEHMHSALGHCCAMLKLRSGVLLFRGGLTV